MKLDLKAAALAGGLVWGLGLFVLTWWIIAFEGQTGEQTIIGMVYRGYNISATGSIIGMIWGFLDGLIGGFIFAWLYNKIVSKSSPILNAG